MTTNSTGNSSLLWLFAIAFVSSLLALSINAALVRYGGQATRAAVTPCAEEAPHEESSDRHPRREAPPYVET
jgi:hypothetical protein